MTTQNLSVENQAEAEAIANSLPFTDEIILSQMQESMKEAFKATSSLANGGAMVYLNEEATAIWDKAVEIAFNKWLTTRAAE